MRIIGNDQKNNGQNFWEILERIIGKISSIIGAGLVLPYTTTYAMSTHKFTHLEVLCGTGLVSLNRFMTQVFS